MDPELKRELEEIHALVKDNHRMLKATRRDQWFGVIIRIIIWAIVLLLPLYIYQQYLQPLVAQFSVTQGGVPNSFGIPSSAEIQKLIDSYKAGLQ